MTQGQEDLVSRLRMEARWQRRHGAETCAIPTTDLEALLDLTIDQARRLDEVHRRGWVSTPARADAPASFRPTEGRS